MKIGMGGNHLPLWAKHSWWRSYGCQLFRDIMKDTRLNGQYVWFYLKKKLCLLWTVRQNKNSLNLCCSLTFSFVKNVNEVEKTRVMEMHMKLELRIFLKTINVNLVKFLVNKWSIAQWSQKQSLKFFSRFLSSSCTEIAEIDCWHLISKQFLEFSHKKYENWIWNCFSY